MKSYVAIINGPNLNLLGHREPEFYGNVSMESFLTELATKIPDLEIQYAQSNVEGELVNLIQQHGFEKNCIGIVLNGAGYSHTSMAMADAVIAVPNPVICVHISNTLKRESARHTDLIAAHANGMIIGLGLEGYRLAVQYLKNLSIEKE